MALRFASGSNGFLPEATGQVIGFVRKESDFAINRWVQYVQAPAPVGVYAKIGRDQSVRITSDAENAWEDGDVRPSGEANKDSFDTETFRCFRRNYGWRLGYQAIDTSKLWKPKPVHMSSAISRCMTNRTKRVVDLVTTTGNWGSNTATANALNGGAGAWPSGSGDEASGAYLAIHKTLAEAARRIHLATNGRVKPGMLRVIIGPDDAILIAQAPEIVEWTKYGPMAAKYLEEGFDRQYELFGVPRMYKGFEFVVEDAVIVQENAKASGVEATTNRTYIWPSGTAVIASREGALDGDFGAPAFSTVQLYHYGGLLQVTAFDDPENERVKGNVTENIDEVLAAAVAGFCITGIV